MWKCYTASKAVLVAARSDGNCEIVGPRICQFGDHILLIDGAYIEYRVRVVLVAVRRAGVSVSGGLPGLHTTTEGGAGEASNCG